jgi:predicted dehydrogenase
MGRKLGGGAKGIRELASASRAHRVDRYRDGQIESEDWVRSTDRSQKGANAMKELRSAIIGCGTIHPWHAGPIGRIEGADLIAVADVIEERAEEASKNYKAEPYTDYQEMLKRNDIDVVHVCTPSGSHAQIGLDVISAGKHVLIEKPMEIKTERIDALAKAAKDKGVKLGGVFQMRFYPSTQKVREALKEGRFGKVVLAEVENKIMRTVEYYQKDAWRGTWELDGGGALMNQGVHSIDLIQHLMGPVERLCALTKTLTRPIEVEDTAAAILEFKSGAIGLIKGTTSLYPGFPSRVYVHGDAGSAEIRGEYVYDWKFAEVKPGDEDVISKEEIDPKRGSDPRAQKDFGHESVIRDFYGAIRDDREPFVTGREARKAVEIILAIYHSSKTGKWVDLPFNG